MRDEILRVALSDDANIDTLETIRLPDGGYEEVWVEAWAGKGRLSSMTSEDMELAQRIEARGTWAITLPVGAPVDTAVQLRILGKTLSITGVLAPESQDVALRVFAVENG